MEKININVTVAESIKLVVNTFKEKILENHYGLDDSFVRSLIDDLEFSNNYKNYKTNEKFLLEVKLNNPKTYVCLSTSYTIYGLSPSNVTHGLLSSDYDKLIVQISFYLRGDILENVKVNQEFTFSYNFRMVDIGFDFDKEKFITNLSNFFNIFVTPGISTILINNNDKFKNLK